MIIVFIMLGSWHTILDIYIYIYADVTRTGE